MPSFFVLFIAIFAIILTMSIIFISENKPKKVSKKRSMLFLAVGVLALIFIIILYFALT